MELTLSTFGLARLVVKPDAWKLYEYVKADKIRGYEATSVKTFVAERMGDGLTIESMYNEWKNQHDE